MQSIHLRNSCFGSESRPSSPPLSGNLLHGRPWWSRDVQLGSISAGYWDSKTKKKIVETTIYLTSWWVKMLIFATLLFSAKAIFLFYYLKSLFADFWMWGKFFQRLTQQLPKPDIECIWSASHIHSVPNRNQSKRWRWCIGIYTPQS